MASADPLAAIPKGTYTLNFSDAYVNSDQNSSRATDEVLALRYAFKPVSIEEAVSGALAMMGGRPKQMDFDLPSGSRQVFDVREEISKAHEYVMVFDDPAQAFTIHPLPQTLHLTLNRTASAKSKPPSAGRRDPSADGSNSSRSSTDGGGGGSSLPLAGKKRKAQGIIDAPPKATKPKATTENPKAVAVTVPSTSTKIASAAKSKAKPKSAAKATTTTKKSTAKGKGKEAPAAVAKGKIKSVEIIEDSDVDDDDGDGGQGDEEDIFAKMLDEDLAAAEQSAAPQAMDYEEEYEDEDEEYEQEDEDDEGGQGGDGSEWL